MFDAFFETKPLESWKSYDALEKHHYNFKYPFMFFRLVYIWYRTASWTTFIFCFVCRYQQSVRNKLHPLPSKCPLAVIGASLTSIQNATWTVIHKALGASPWIVWIQHHILLVLPGNKSWSLHQMDAYVALSHAELSLPNWLFRLFREEWTALTPNTRTPCRAVV